MVTWLLVYVNILISFFLSLSNKNSLPKIGKSQFNPIGILQRGLYSACCLVTISCYQKPNKSIDEE